jgi:hypothetical protein
MRALEVAEGPRKPLFAWLPVAGLTILGVLFAAAGSVADDTRAAGAPVRAAGLILGHGALLGAAVRWACLPGDGRGAAGSVVGALAAAACVAAVLPFGALAFAAVPAVLWRVTRRRGRALGLGVPASPQLVALGAGLGALLGGHVLVTATMTMGYPVRIRATWELLEWVLYDAGASVLAMECFFRGVVFDRAQRRWSFAVAAALSAAGSVARVLVDPLRPRTIEVAVGTVFYVGLLSVTSCWLFHRTGSLVPGLASSLVFFFAYRLLMPAAG